MKKIQLLLLLSCCMSVVASSSSSSSSSSRVHQEKNFLKVSSKRSVVTKKDYTPHEFLIETIEEGQDKIDSFVTTYGVEILSEIDPHTGQDARELAYEAENVRAFEKISGYLGIK